MSFRAQLLKASVFNLDDAVAAIGDKYSGRVLVDTGGGIRIWRGRGPEIDPARKAWTEELLTLLNTEAWLDGLWCLIWTDFDLTQAAYGRCVAVYMDKDGDTQFFVDFEDRFEVLLFELFDKVSDCIEAYGHWKEHMKLVGVRADQTIKASQGQESVDKAPQPDIDILSL